MPFVIVTTLPLCTEVGSIPTLANIYVCDGYEDCRMATTTHSRFKWICSHFDHIGNSLGLTPDYYFGQEPLDW
jgi:hypothetical protein